jgi:hypothetical protein
MPRFDGGDDAGEGAAADAGEECSVIEAVQESERESH